MLHMIVPAHKFIAKSLVNNTGKCNCPYDMQKKDSSLFLLVIDCWLQVAKWLIPSEDQQVYHEVMLACQH